jgi:hypothetical protein
MEARLFMPAKGLMNFIVTLYPHNFVFLIGHHCYRCSFAVGDFLAPKISGMHHSDVTL